jgi:mucin-19
MANMTLPQGYFQFVDDTVLPADAINGYLMQGILVFDDASDRDTALVGNLREGQYAYLKSDNTTYVYSGTAWNRVGKQDVETEKNFQAFTGSGGTTVPAWATKMYYLVVGGGGAGGASQAAFTNGAGGAGGQVVQSSTSVTGGTSLTITIGGSAANSSVAISGGSTFTATGAGGAASGTNGTQPSAPFNVGYFGGGGATTFNWVAGGASGQFAGQAPGYGGGGSGTGGSLSTGSPVKAQHSGQPNSGGGGGAYAAGQTASTGGSGIVLLYFS